jgi:hypothetical protein
MRTDFNRRSLLLTLGGALMMPPLVVAHAGSTTTPALADTLRRLRGSSRLPRGARLVARKYRALPGHAHQPNQLLASLRASASANTPQGIAELFARQRADDFANHQVVLIDGWMFARAEAELCELIAG